MANQPSPDGRLVYLHCSSIFSGANAHVRKAKKIVQLLQIHRSSIKILTKEFTFPAIAAVVKELLEEHIFESLPRARLRYPELFQPSETREAEREASEADVLRIEAEAVQDIVLISDDEGGDKCLEPEQGGQRAENEGTVKFKGKAADNVQISAAGFTQSKSQAHQALSIPRLHPVYLPFKTQHHILVSVQRLLEECCLEFGNTWIPDLMEARKWHEAESIELTQWTKRFSKYTKSLPPSAMKPIVGKDIAEVLFGTSSLRHSAVHRLPTSAVGIVNMLSAATTFAEALNDSERAEKIAGIKMQLEASIKEIVQHQNLLEWKLTNQLEDIARRRAELDELESSSIEEMLARDKEQRAKVGSAFESVLVGCQQVSNPCACSHTPSFDKPKADSEAGESIESSGIGQEEKPQDGVDRAQAHDRRPFCEGEPDQSEEWEEEYRPPRHDKIDSGVEGEPEISNWAIPKKGKKGKKGKKEEKAAASGWDTSAAEEAPVLVYEAPVPEDAPPAPEPVAHDLDCEWPRYEIENWRATSDVPAEPPDAVKEDVPAAGPCFGAPEEEPLADDAFPAEEAILKEDLTAKEEATPEATLEASRAELIIDDVEEYHFKQHDIIQLDLDDDDEPAPERDVASMHSAPAEDAEFLAPPPRPAFSAVRHKSDLSPSAPSSTVTSVLEAAAQDAPTEDGHTITLKILNGSKVLRSIVVIKSCTRRAILDEARAYCTECAQDDQGFGRLLAMGWDLALVSLNMYGYDMDMSAHKTENLSSLVQAIEKTEIPRFTLRIFKF